MSSGHRRTILNTRERVISDDWNLLQAQAAAQRAAIMRHHYGHELPNRTSVEFPGLHPVGAALPGLTRGTVHDVYGGLMVRPDGGSYLLVDAGVAGMFLPDFAGLTPNDYPYIVVTSPGVTDSTEILFTANGGAGPRIDVVECRAVDVLVSSDSRDIIQSATNTITAETVEKVREAELEFRVRLGTANAGFPAVEQDWLPLAVIVTPTTATGFGDCDVYDVRPLVTERTNLHGSDMLPGDGNFGGANINDRSIPGRDGKVSGWVHAESHGYRVGGLLMKNTPTAPAGFGSTGDASYLLTTSNESHMVGAAAPSVTSGNINAVVLAFPMGLPRWVRYSEAAAANTITGQQTVVGRLPRGTNGILLLGRPADLTAKGQCTVASYPALFGTGAASGQTDLGLVVGWTVGNGTTQLAVDSQGKRNRIWGPDALWPQAMTVPSLPDDPVNVTSPVIAKALVPNLNLATNGNRVPMTARGVFFRVAYSGETSGPAVVDSSVKAIGGSGYVQSDAGSTDVQSTFTPPSGDPVFSGDLFLSTPMLHVESGPPIAHTPMSAEGTTTLGFVTNVRTSTITVTALTVNMSLAGWDDF